jgi:hypothetical protein
MARFSSHHIGVASHGHRRTVIKRSKIDHATRQAAARLLASSIAYYDAGKPHLADMASRRLVEVLKANGIMGYE